MQTATGTKHDICACAHKVFVSTPPSRDAVDPVTSSPPSFPCLLWSSLYTLPLHFTISLTG